MSEVTIGLLHPGEMGAAVGQSLVTAGHQVLWLPAGRSEATAVRARAAGLTGAADLADLGDPAPGGHGGGLDRHDPAG